MEFDGATVTVREANVATPLLDGITVGVLGGGFLGFSVAEETAFRLDFVDLQNSQGGGVLTGSYAYDPLNRRVHKQVSDGSQVTATAYVYDGWRCIEEWEATWPVGSQPPNPTYTLAAQYVHGGYIDELLVMRRDVDDNGSLEEYLYHADDKFNIVAVTNASGAVVERYEYGPFGKPTILDPSGAVRTESAIGNAHLWNGREYDAESGLYYYRLRYLDPELGRFTTLDPIGLWGDPNNLGNGYAYVGNRPWTGLDPFGLYGANAWHNAYLASRMQHGETLVDLSSPRVRGALRMVGGGLGLVAAGTALTGEAGLTAASLGAASPATGLAAIPTVAGAWYSADNMVTGYNEFIDNQSYDLMTTRAIASLTGSRDFAYNLEVAIDAAFLLKGLYNLSATALKTSDDVAQLGNQCPAEYTDLADAAPLTKEAKGAVRYVPSGPMKGRRIGHTFSKHGSHNTYELLQQARNSGRPQGQWIDDAAAESFIADHLPGLENGARTFDLPPGLGRVILPDGTAVPATRVRLQPSNSGVLTAYPQQ